MSKYSRPTQAIICSENSIILLESNLPQGRIIFVLNIYSTISQIVINFSSHHNIGKTLQTPDVFDTVKSCGPPMGNIFFQHEFVQLDLVWREILGRKSEKSVAEGCTNANERRVVRPAGGGTPVCRGGGGPVAGRQAPSLGGEYGRAQKP